MDYETFELLIGPQGIDGYPVTVTRSPGGTGEGTLFLDPQEGYLQEALALIEQRAVDRETLAQIGSFLFRELFRDGVGTIYRSSLASVRKRGSRLRLRLRLTAPEVAALPWEYLYDPDEKQFPAVSPETALMRFVSLDQSAHAIAVTAPLRLLVVISHPAGVARLDAAHERAIITEALAQPVGQGLMELHFVEQAHVAAINQAMRTVQPHIFHFIGHGHFDGERAFVVLEDENGQAKMMDETLFREFFTGCKETRLAFLNACQSAGTSSSSPLVGLAASLLRRNLSAVIAMQYPITDAAALIFSREFYRALAVGRAVDVAVSEARKAIFMELDPEQPDWGTPVLFLRADDGHIFHLNQSGQSSTPVIPPPGKPKEPPLFEGFVGREAELTRYADALAHYGIAVVAGMPGIGKTALASVLSQRVSVADKRFWHTFNPGEGVMSILWELAAFLAWHGRLTLWEMIQGIALSGGDMPPPSILLDYFLQALKGQGYLLVLDNLQIVIEDPALEQLISRVRAAVQAGEVRLILVSQRVPEFVQLAHFDPLSGLSFPETQHFFESRGLALVPGLVAELYRCTGGNPLLLTLAAAVCANTPPEQLVAHLLTSQDVERFLLNQVDEHLDAGEKAAMGGLAALLGFPGTRDAIEEVLDGKNVRRQLTDLVNQYLLEAAQAGRKREYGQHAIVQVFYYGLLGRRERQAMHRRAARYYEFEEVDDLRAALHYQYAGDIARAAILASRDVWDHIFQGHARPVLGILAGLQESHFPDDSGQWVESLLAWGNVAGYLEELETARSAYEDLLALLEAQPQLPQAATLRARACRGMAYLLRQRSAAESLQWAERGLAGAGELPVRLRADLLIQRAVALRLTGESDASLASLQEALALLPVGAVYERMLGMLNLGYLHFHAGRFAEAIRAEEEALVLARSHHNRPNELVIVSNLASFRHKAGDWVGAAQGYAAAEEMARELGNLSELARAVLNRGALALCQGEYSQARRCLVFSLEELKRQGDLRFGSIARLYLARLHLQEGQPSLAGPLLAEAETGLAQAQMAYLKPMFYEVRAQLHLAEGRTEEAESHILRSLDEARRQKMPDEEGTALRQLARLRALAGAEEESDSLFTQSLVAVGENPYEAALTQQAWGEQLLDWGKETGGSEKLRAAREIFNRLGVKEPAS